MKYAFLSLCMFLWLVRTGESAQPVHSYTLADCLSKGRERAARTANARRLEVSARASVREARAEALPHLDLKGGYTRIDEVSTFDLGEGPIQIGSEDNYVVSAGLSQVLYKGGQVQAALRAAKVYQDYARQGRRAVEAALDRDICLAFHGMQLAEAEAAVENESVLQLRRMVARAESQLAQQTIPEFELLSARVRLANALPRQIAASNRLEICRENLRMLAYLDDGDYALEGKLAMRQEARGLDQYLVAALQGRPELAQLDSQVRLRREDCKVAEAAYKPTIRAFGNYQGGNSSTYAPMQTEWDWHWTAGATVEWAIADGGRRSAVWLQKKLAFESAEADLEEMRRMVALEVRQAYLGLKHAEEAIRVAQETEALAERGLAIAAVRHAQGVATYLEFTETNLALSTARLQMLQALYAHSAARVTVRFAAGLPVEEEMDDEKPVVK